MGFAELLDFVYGGGLQDVMSGATTARLMALAGCGFVAVKALRWALPAAWRGAKAAALACWHAVAPPPSPLARQLLLALADDRTHDVDDGLTCPGAVLERIDGQAAVWVGKKNVTDCLRESGELTLVVAAALARRGQLRSAQRSAQGADAAAELEAARARRLTVEN